MRGSAAGDSRATRPGVGAAKPSEEVLLTEPSGALSVGPCSSSCFGKAEGAAATAAATPGRCDGRPSDGRPRATTAEDDPAGGGTAEELTTEEEAPGDLLGGGGGGGLACGGATGGCQGPRACCGAALGSPKLRGCWDCCSKGGGGVLRLRAPLPTSPPLPSPTLPSPPSPPPTTAGATCWYCAHPCWIPPRTRSALRGKRSSAVASSMMQSLLLASPG